MLSDNVDPESDNVDPESSEMPVNYGVLRKPCSKNASLSDPKIESRKATVFETSRTKTVVCGRVPSHAIVPSPVPQSRDFAEN